MIYDVRHVTTVRYASIVRLARLNLRLKPAFWPSQILRDYSLRIDPLPWTVQDEPGPYIVNRSRLTLKDPIARLTIESRFTVEVMPQHAISNLAPGPTVGQVRKLALASVICPRQALHLTFTRRQWQGLSPRSATGRKVSSLTKHPSSGRVKH